MKGGFSHHFYKTQPITRERFDELAALRSKILAKYQVRLRLIWMPAGVPR